MRRRRLGRDELAADVLGGGRGAVELVEGHGQERADGAPDALDERAVLRQVEAVLLEDDLLGVGGAGALHAAGVLELRSGVGHRRSELVHDQLGDAPNLSVVGVVGEREPLGEARLGGESGELAVECLLLLLLDDSVPLVVGALLVATHPVEEVGLVVLGDAAGLLLASVHRLRTGLGQVGVRTHGGGLLVLAVGHEGLLIVGCES